MAFKKVLLEDDAKSEVEAADPLVLAGDVTIVGSGKSLEVINLKMEAATELTMDAGGDITVTQVYHNVDTNADGASDDLDGIVGGNDGQILIIRPNDDGRTVVVRHNQNAATTKNILLSNNTNYSMDAEHDMLMLIYEAALDTNGAWVEIARGAGGVAALTSSAPANVGITAAVGDGSEAARDNHVHDTAAGFIDNTDKFGSGVVDQAALAANSVGNSEIRGSDTDIAFNQIILTAKASGDGTVPGTLYFDSDDNHPYIFQA